MLRAAAPVKLSEQIVAVGDRSGMKEGPVGRLDGEMDMRVVRLEDEVDALKREVEVLREEIRSLARLLDQGDIPGAPGS